MRNISLFVAFLFWFAPFPLRAQCISIPQNLSVTVPTADFAGTTISFSLERYADPADSANIFFKLDKVAEIAPFINISATVTSSLDINLPCIVYQGTQFAVSLMPHTNQLDPSWYYWKLGSVQKLTTPFILEPKPLSLPDFASLSLYSQESPFNTPISATPSIDPNTQQLIASMMTDGTFLITVKKFSSPVYFATDFSPDYAVETTCGIEWGLQISHLSGVPIPEHADPAYDGESGDGAPTGCGEGPDQDNHMVVLDLESRCEFDFWQARKTSEGWQASWVSSISMDSNGIYPKGISTRGSGFAFLGGVIWPDELIQGKIAHALAFNYPFTKAGGPVAPATDSDGEKKGEHLLPEGALLQLNPELDLDTLKLTSYEHTIAVALQNYGMYLVDDSSSGIGLYAVDPKSVASNPYSGVLPDEEWPLLPNIPLNEFRVIQMGPQDADFQDKLTPHESGCGEFVNNQVSNVTIRKVQQNSQPIQYRFQHAPIKSKTQ